MAEVTNQQGLSKTEKAIKDTVQFITNKRTRGFVFMALSFVFILGLNALLPVIEGESHYTANVVETTYGEYVAMKEEDEHLRLTWSTEQSMKYYIEKYIETHPTMTVDEQMMLTVPDGYPVKMYTKFFYQHPFWYISTAVSIGSTLILFYSVFNYLVIVLKEKYKPYVDLNEKMRELTTNSLDPVTFEPWVDGEFNKHRKIQQHKANVKYALDKLEHVTPYKIKRKLRDYFMKLKELDGKEVPAEVYEKLGPLNLVEKLYLRRREQLLYLLEPAYIDEYVANGRVKHFRYIYPMFVYSGTNNLGRTIDSYSLIRSDTEKLGRDAAGRITLSLTITFLFAVMTTVTIIAAYEQSPFWIVMSIITKLAPLILQVVLAVNYSNVFMDGQLIGNLINRRAISLLYLADQKAKEGGDQNAKTN